MNNPLLPHNPIGERTVHTLDARGYIRDWLTAPAWSTPCEDLDMVLEADGSPWGEYGRWVLTNGPDVGPLKGRLYQIRPLDLGQQLPEIREGEDFSWYVERARRTSRWERRHVGADGLLDWSEFCFTPQYRQAIAATVLEVDQAEYRILEVGCTGPAALFVDGELLWQSEDFTYMEPHRDRVRVRLRSGTTAIHLVTWQVAFRECRHVASLRVRGLPVRVVIPSPEADEYRSAAAESLLEAVGIDPWASIDGTVRLTGPVGARYEVATADGAVREVVLTDGSAIVALDDRAASLVEQATPGLDGTAPDQSFSAAVDSYARTIGVAAPGFDNSAVSDSTAADLDDPASATTAADATASMLSTGETTLTVRIPDPAAPVTRQLRAARVPESYRAGPEGDPQRWRAELMRHVAAGVPGVARALARHVLDPHTKLSDDDLAPPLWMIDSRSDCADFEAVGLIHLWKRLDEEAWTPDQRDRVRRSLLGFKYWIDQPGLDAMCYFTENHQFVWHTAETLAGELFPDEMFTNTGRMGSDHAEHGRQLAVEWMRRKMSGGFSEFDSNAYLAIDSLALVSWVEFAADDRLRRLAEALLDKALLTLACNSWHGIHGAAHGRSYVPTLRSSRFEETAPIMWTLWGTGALNAAVLPATALATARRYHMPELIRAIATAQPQEWDGRQVYRGDYRQYHDLLSRPYGSDLRVWRTPDAMLSSVQDYRSGLPGLQEHIWGATLGPEVQVFATHPAAASTSSSARPNAWAGQRILPRAHQHRDTVLALHRIPGDDPFGSTHLWFPTPHLDEWTVHGPWLAGRLGAGYVAVAAAGGFRPHTTGDEAYQSWLPRGDGLGYVATVGRAAVSGCFADFVAALGDPEFGDGFVRWRAGDGRELALHWPGAFTVNGSAATDFVADPPHLDNPAVHVGFGDDRLEAVWDGHRLVLDLAEGRRIEPASAVLPVRRPRR
ncbi:hypothetical protein KO481_27885 [Nocardia sp. NEAU-G5]|uniref:Uncharacterized protein n=1 Tax=Nocardia albiluteola TaxID=2842303 RepID=A0ABS6B7F9_9NOCA|nr:hypothetical protein [Nocardia albiluteola]MBU3065336.1 hypothetical protein [Nocardia albiluteola]